MNDINSSLEQFPVEYIREKWIFFSFRCVFSLVSIASCGSTAAGSYCDKMF